MSTMTGGKRVNRAQKDDYRLLKVAIVIFAAALVLLFISKIAGWTKETQIERVDGPDWAKQELLEINPYSRPGTKLEAVNGVVIHYVGNPNTSAEQNRDYFSHLAITGETSASSHFVIDLDGTTIQCVPLDEVAYCSNTRNSDTISIECCHPDETGEFTEETIQSLTALVQWLCDTYHLERDQVIRHYDITGKLCPLYFVEHPDVWEEFLDSITYSG